MKIQLEKLLERKYDWEIFTVELEPGEECNLDPLKYVGDYDIQCADKTISFHGILDKVELRYQETIEERLELIQADIENLVNSCITH